MILITKGDYSLSNTFEMYHDKALVDSAIVKRLVKTISKLEDALKKHNDQWIDITQETFQININLYKKVLYGKE